MDPMTYLQDIDRKYYALRKLVDSRKEFIARHVREVYSENHFKHGEVPNGLNEGIDIGVRIVFLQVEGILNTTNLPRPFCLILIQNLIDLSLTALNETKDTNVFNVDRIKTWKEVQAVLDEEAELAA
jgi:hypothetical protein